MRYENYELRYQQGVELVGCGHNWDLHNFASLVEVTHEPDTASCAFVWLAESVPNPCGDASNNSSACRLEFQQVSRFVHRPGSGSSDRSTLEEISAVPQDSADNHEALEYDLWVRCGDGTMYKVRAGSTRLVPLPPGAA